MLSQSPPKDVITEFTKECFKTCRHYLFSSYPELHGQCVNKCVNDKIKQWQTTSGGNGNGGNGSGNGENGGNEIAKAGFPVMPIVIGVSALMVASIIYILVKGKNK